LRLIRKFAGRRRIGDRMPVDIDGNWTCGNCGVWVQLGDGLEQPDHDLCHLCSTAEVSRLRKVVKRLRAKLKDKAKV